MLKYSEYIDIYSLSLDMSRGCERCMCIGVIIIGVSKGHFELICIINFNNLIFKIESSFDALPQLNFIKMHVFIIMLINDLFKF